MWFLETPVFTRQVVDLLSDDDYRALQMALLLRPEQGAVIRSGGGLRKLRWREAGSGKRGGIRVIYHWIPRRQAFYMLFAYRKSRQDDLTPEQLRILRRVVEEEFA